MKDARDSGVPVWKQPSGRAEDKASCATEVAAQRQAFELPTDARGLVEALRKATVGPDKSTKITRMTMAKIYRDHISEVVADDALLRDIVAVIRGALNEGQDERIAEGLKRLKAAPRRRHTGAQGRAGARGGGTGARCTGRGRGGTGTRGGAEPGAGGGRAGRSCGAERRAGCRGPGAGPGTRSTEG